jgi:hypothetical protein
MYRLSIKHIKLLVSNTIARLIFIQKALALLPFSCNGSEERNFSAAARAAGSGFGDARTLNALRRRIMGSYVSRRKGMPTRAATPHRTGGESKLDYSRLNISKNGTYWQ